MKIVLRELGVVQLGEEKALATPYCSLSIYKNLISFTRPCRDGIKDSSFKLKKSRLRMHVRRNLFTMRVVRHWDRLPRQTVAAPSLEVFKVRSDGTLNNLM